MTSDAVRKAETRGIAQDDQHLASIDDGIATIERKRAKLNAYLRRLRAERREIITRRDAEDVAV